jgi:hypothetical protein
LVSDTDIEVLVTLGGGVVKTIGSDDYPFAICEGDEGSDFGAGLCVPEAGGAVPTTG